MDSALSQERPFKVLIIEDNDADADLISRFLARAKSARIETERAVRVSSAIELLTNRTFDLVLSDLNLPDSAGIDAFLRVHALYPDIPVIVLTGLDDEATAITAVRSGAQDYLVKDRIDTHILVKAIRYAVERQKLLTQLETSLREIKTLRGLIPACAWCRKIRDDKGYWKNLEKYLQDHLEVSFTHGICPSCLKKVRPELYEKLKLENPKLLEES